MNSLFGERATAELVGKLRLLTACELCKKPCNETYYAAECGHYTCKNCLRPVNDACAKCNVPGTILRAHYLDPISETLLRLKDLLCGDQTPKPGANKRKADQDITTPTTKAIKSAAAVTKNSYNLKSPTIDAIFARKSKPSSTGTPVSSRIKENQSPMTPSILKSAEEVLIGNVNLSTSIRDSPLVGTEVDGGQARCSCGNQGSAPPRKSSDLGVQVSNSVLTFDVAVHAKPAMTDAQMQTDESMSGLSRPILLSTGIQTERPHINVKRYFEASVQTEDQNYKLCLDDGCADSKSLTSTQAAGVNQTVHAQPISLDMSPIKQIDRSNALEKSASKPVEQKTAEFTIEFSADEPNREVASNANEDLTICSKKDTLDSLDFKTMELREAGDEPEGKKTTAGKQPSPEPDSLDFLPSELHNNADEAAENSPSKNDKDTLESFFKSSEEASIPETQASLDFASPIKASKSKRANVQPDPDSPLKLIEKKKRTVIISDEDEPSSKTRFDGTDQRNRVPKTKAALKAKENRTLKKSQSQIAKALPTFSSDEDDADPLPMDTEDMRNLEKEIENLDREMEDSKLCGKSRFG